MRLLQQKKYFKKLRKTSIIAEIFQIALGGIDGKHIRMKCPPNSGSQYFNYKLYHSVVFQAVANANLKFVSLYEGGGAMVNKAMVEISDIQLCIRAWKHRV